MKKILFFALSFILASNSLFSSNDVYFTHEDFVEFNITEINRFDKRVFFINQLYYSTVFDISLGEKDGVFYISLKNESPELEQIFDNFYEETNYAYELLSKEETSMLFHEYKSALPEAFINHLMMDSYNNRSDNGLCATALPFCTDQGLYMFPAGVNSGSGEEGPDYDCLNTSPNPAWYYLRIDQPGSIEIHMESNPEKDIDFCCWGPFDDPIEPCPNGLTEDKVVSCSYSGSYSETCRIPATATTNEYYILIITNYSNAECNISFEKVGGEGTTDCSILPPLVSSNSPICYGDTLFLEAQQINNAYYTWEGPDGWTSHERNPIRENASLEMSGTYSCNISVENQQSEPVTMEVDIFATTNADFEMSPEGTQGFNEPIQFTCKSTSNPANHISSRLWDFGDGTTSTEQNPVHSYSTSGTYEISLTVSSGDEFSCTDTETKTIEIISTFSVELTADNNHICETDSTQLHAIASGGTNQYSYSWTPTTGLSNPNIANPIFIPGDIEGNSQSFSYTCSIDDNMSVLEAQITIDVYNVYTVFDTLLICDQNSYQWGDIMLTEDGDYEQMFNSSNSCDSLVYLHFMIAEETEETVIDTVCNDGVSFYENAYHIYEWDFPFPGKYSGTKERLNDAGCKMIVNYNLLLLNKLEVSEIDDVQSQLVYYSGTGFDFYYYSIDEVTGGGTDEVINGFENVHETYEWSLEMINGDKAWSCVNEGNNNTTVNITCQGAAYLYCNISTMCGTTTKWILLYTPGQQPCDDAFNLKTELISNEWAEISWQSPADSCEVRYGTDENCSEHIITTKKNIQLVGLTPDTQYFWQVRSLCGNNTDFVDGPSFKTYLNVDIEDYLTEDKLIKMYPNPAKDNLTIEGKDIKMIEIYNTIGLKIFKDDKITDDITNININNINEGLYLVRIILNNDKIIVRRLVIE